MKETLKEINNMIRATETARTKLKMERDKLTLALKEQERVMAEVEANAKNEVLNGPKAKEYKNEGQRKIAIQALTNSSLEYMTAISREEKINSDIRELEYQLRDNLTEVNYLKRDYELNKLAWQAEIQFKG